MTVVVFVGPTLAADEVPECLKATILPPVRQGDVYRVARGNPKAIGIIDGYFEGVPSVWHKEILWAIEQGIPVFGSASMGALRAAELADFGMIGVGDIFEDYRSGALLDDDEVAVLHSPAELGFQPLSEPMVSVRATVDKAVKQGAVTPDAAVAILRVAKDIHYTQRTWARVLSATQGVSGAEGLSDWLPEGRVDAKARDARQMLEHMSQSLTAGEDLGRPVRTENTLMWQSLRARIDAETSVDLEAAIIDEIRLEPDLYRRLRDQAMLVLLSRDAARRLGFAPDREALLQQMSAHQARAGLPRRADLMRWLDLNDMSPQDYENMLADMSCREQASDHHAQGLGPLLVAQLRREGLYPQLRDRAARKAALGANGAADSMSQGTNRLRHLMWYFETRLDQPVPDHLESYAASVGLDGRDALIELIEAEFLYCRTRAEDGGEGLAQ